MGLHPARLWTESILVKSWSSRPSPGPHPLAGTGISWIGKECQGSSPLMQRTVPLGVYNLYAKGETHSFASHGARSSFSLKLPGCSSGCCPQAHRQSPILNFVASAPRSQDPSLRRRYPASPVLSFLSELPPAPPPRAALRARPSCLAGLPQMTRVTLPACRAHYPGGPRRVRLSVASPPRAAFPVSQPGRRPATSLSRPAQASLALRPVGSLSRPRRPLSRGFDPPGCPDKPLVSYQINRRDSLGGTFLHW